MIGQGYMDLALEEGAQAAERGEVPVGAVIVLDGEVHGAGRQPTRGNSMT
jgi:tRNA(adenine34) deaminase